MRSKLVDQDARNNILEDDNDIIISASAGSGKTTIMVSKMEIELNKIVDHKTIAAITFTVKATQEIKKKAQKSIKKSFVVMTNDAFVENEITRPFIRDAFGEEYSDEYSVEYGNQYKFSNLVEGLQQMKTKKILGSFQNNRQNFKFKIALLILKRSIAAKEYLTSKYKTVFIDEYQDSDQDMHEFFMFLKSTLNIKIFIVGDAKQAIYMWRGAMSNIFELLAKEKFSRYELVTNFRCHKDIENYANLLHNKTYFDSENDLVNNVVLKKYSDRNFKNLPISFLNLVENKVIDLNKEITIISNINSEAQQITRLLNENNYDFAFIPRTPIDEGLPNGYLLKELAMFSKNSDYTIYDFLEHIGNDERTQTRIEINRIISSLKKTDNLVEEKIMTIVNNLSSYLGIEISLDESTKFCESICNSQYDMAFQMVDKKHKVMTVFASKGLEFDQVISFSRYYNIQNDENMQNHYVCITRAKEKLVMFVDNEIYSRHVIKISFENKLNEVNKLFKEMD